ncbi:bile acid:sodium symporter family protein [Rufibacter glacialis]|uniref:Bile acid:sodium symporter n=1 Tax=Rufibacter glacialis TaxID=1259555 RepID=A0A5M8QHV9_9BACT|nr:bile acid:sodium symporter family protein [Rufibacter glacialis]KAA6434376.1 bile acid:sodium symporter [Rufibacter glacialis]GGK69002.1 transporter [Rufibacter glacialis]
MKDLNTPPAEAAEKKNSLSIILKRFGLDNFLLFLLAMILLAYLWPELGEEEGPLPLEEITTYGVALIFFFYGLRLSPAKLKEGLSDWRLHLVVQATTFVLFPLLVWAGHLVAGPGENPALWLGAFYVAALPSTVSSSVVMVSIAGGNIPGAIFNASISSLIGVFMTPLWMSFFASTSSAAQMDLTSVILKLMLQVVLPVTLGILLNKKFGAFAEGQKSRLRVFDQTIILLIVYSSFCDSFARNMFQGFSGLDLFLLGAVMVGLFLLVVGLTAAISHLLGFSRENRITAIFCGSKKSLVHGTVMSKVLFPDANAVGIILLPLMLYHALQLIIASMLAQRMARKEITSAQQMAG